MTSARNIISAVRLGYGYALSTGILGFRFVFILRYLFTSFLPCCAYGRKQINTFVIYLKGFQSPSDFIFKALLSSLRFAKAHLYSLSNAIPPFPPKDPNTGFLSLKKYILAPNVYAGCRVVTGVDTYLFGCRRSQKLLKKYQ